MNISDMLHINLKCFINNSILHSLCNLLESKSFLLQLSLILLKLNCSDSLKYKIQDFATWSGSIDLSPDTLWWRCKSFWGYRLRTDLIRTCKIIFIINVIKLDTVYWICVYPSMVLTYNPEITTITFDYFCISTYSFI